MENLKTLTYSVNENTSLNLYVSLETQRVWFTINDLALIFKKDRSAIGKQIRMLIKNGDLICPDVAQTLPRCCT